MKLRAWLSKEKMTAAEFARVSGIGHRQSVFKILTKGQFPSPDNLARIREATGGAVTPDDFLDEHIERRPESQVSA